MARPAVVLCAALCFCAAVAAARQINSQQFQLHIVAHYPISQLPPSAEFFLRGSNAELGLSWSRGVRLGCAGDECSAVFNYTGDLKQRDLEVKVLGDDSVWQIGANEVITQIPLDEQSPFSRWDIYPWFFSETGSIEMHADIYSPQFQDYRNVQVYLPPSFYENPLKVHRNVLIMHDGQNLFNASTSFGGIAWMCQDTVDALVVEGAMSEIIIIGVWNTGASRTDQYTYSYDKTVQAGGQGHLYLDWLSQTLMPQFKKWYPSRALYERENVGMLGSSLGGLISCFACWTRWTEYGSCGCMSSSFWWNSEDFTNTVLIDELPPKELTSGNFLTLYLDSGNKGPDNDDMTQTLAVRTHLEKLGMTTNQDLFYYLDDGGMHSEKYWGARFHEPMTALYSPKPTAPTTAILRRG